MNKKSMKKQCGNVIFVGAGPGDPKLITVAGKEAIEQADLILYAGSLVPLSLFDTCPADTPRLDSSKLSLQEIETIIVRAVSKGQTVARVHTGDPSLYGTIHEQTRILDQQQIPYDIIPGVTAAFAAAAKAKKSFTIPEGTQTLTLTRMAGKTPVPDQEQLRKLATHGNALAVYLSGTKIEELRQELLHSGYAPETTIVVAHKVGWEGEQIVETTLQDLSQIAEQHEFERQTIFLILPHQDKNSVSKLYDPDFSHGFRK